MARRAKPGNDLFEIFPDLPWHRRRNPAELVERVRSQVRLTQARAGENIRRQRAATQRMRELIETQMLHRRRR